MTLTNARQWTRAEYMADECTHQQYYSSLVRTMGAAAVERCVRSIVISMTRDGATDVIEVLRRQLAADEHLNNIPLPYWDRQHQSVIAIVAATATTSGIKAQLSPTETAPGTFPWSLSDSVCCLKACARMMVERAAEGGEVDRCTSTLSGLRCTLPAGHGPYHKHNAAGWEDAR